MQISNTSWRYNLYRRAAEGWFNFLNRGHDNSHWGPSRFGREKWFDTSNICFYIRVILVWAPTMFLLRLSPLLGLWLAFYALPKAAFGLGAFYSVLLVILGGLAIWAATVAGSIALFAQDNFTEAIKKPFRVTGSFLAILGLWLWAKKKKICPTLEFVNPGGSDV